MRRFSEWGHLDGKIAEMGRSWFYWAYSWVWQPRKEEASNKTLQPARHIARRQRRLVCDSLTPPPHTGNKSSTCRPVFLHVGGREKRRRRSEFAWFSISRSFISLFIFNRSLASRLFLKLTGKNVTWSWELLAGRFHFAERLSFIVSCLVHWQFRFTSFFFSQFSRSKINIRSVSNPLFVLRC